MISVIIPAYNEERYIKKTLESLKEQSFKDFEVITVCNGCNDKTSKIAKDYSKVFEIKQKGAALARNYGAKKAKGSLLLFLDADTELVDNKAIEKINNMEVNIATCYFLPSNLGLKYLFFSLIKNLFCHIGTANGSIIIKKDVFNKINGFNEKLFPSENGDLIKKAKNFEKFKVLPIFVRTSMRRYEQKGLFSITFYWLRHLFRKNNNYESIR